MRNDLFLPNSQLLMVRNDLLLSKQLTPQNEEQYFSPEKGYPTLRGTTFACRQNSLVAAINGF
jgi:hypothetical protein